MKINITCARKKSVEKKKVGKIKEIYFYFLIKMKNKNKEKG